MKLDSIQIQHFGHFANFELKFGGQPFVLLFGQNEAGKTTLLEFLRQLLFGFPERTPYNFGEGGELGGSANMVLADRRVVELRRRKGRKNTVQARVDGHDAEIDDAGFRRLLGNANANVFKTVFAFGLDELRTGNEGLKEESLQAALFGGGLGGAFNPESLLKELDEEATDLFKPSASKPSINALSAEIRKLASDIKHKTIRSDDYEQRERNWKEAQAAADRSTAELASLRRKHARTDRLASAIPHWLQLQVFRAERQELVVPAAFPSNAEQQFLTATEAIQRLTREIALLIGNASDAERQIASMQLDRTLLPLRAEIEDCHRLIQSVTDARRDLPLRRDERDKLHEEIVSEVARLRPGWSLDNLRSFSIAADTAHALEELYRRHEELNEERAKLETRRGESLAAIQQNSADLESLGEARDGTALADIAEQSAEFAAEQKALKKESDEQLKLLHTVQSQRARLTPPLPAEAISGNAIPEAARLHSLPIPPRELVNRFDIEFRDLQQRLTAVRQALLDDERNCEQIRRELSTAARQQQSFPSLDELQQQRTARDDMWQSWRAQYFEQKKKDHPAVHPDLYEQAVRTADNTSDRIYEHADEVARREQQVRHLADLEASLNRRQEESRRLTLDQADLERRWLELWQPCGFSPLASDLMLTWLDAFAAFSQTYDALVQRQVDTRSSHERLAAFESWLRELMKTPEGDLKSVIAAARQQAKSAEEDAQQRKRLDRDRVRLEKQSQEIGHQSQRWQDSEARWLADWRQVLSRIGLPEDWNLVLARRVLGQLAAAREKLLNLADLDRRIAKMELRIAEFDPRVRNICQQLGDSSHVERPEISALTLHERLTEATQMHERRANLEDRLAASRRQEQEKTVELADWQAKRDQLLARAAAANDSAFLEVAERARRAAELDAKIQELSGKLAVARGQDSEEVFCTELSTTDAGMLQAKLAELDSALEHGQTAAEEAREKAGSLRRVFEELDASNVAALLQEQLAQQQARLASDVHRYVPLVFAKQLLHSAIQRFERENQPALIRTISRLLATMTRGRYVEIERPSSDHSALYVRRHDGAERSPDQLSTATREQLYLAIRLGYVLHYCQQSESLPVVMDDVLVNFDSERALASLEALREASQHAQILYFTCHRHVLDLAARVFPEVQPLQLPAQAALPP